MGDGFDKLVTIDANPASAQYGKVIHKVSVGGRGEAHHMGFTDDRRFLWAGGLDDSKIFVFDVGSGSRQAQDREAHHRLRRQDRLRGPAHLLRHARAHAGAGPVQHQGQWRRHRLRRLQQPRRAHQRPAPCPPTTAATATATTSPSIPQKNVMLSSSFTGRANYMRELGKLVGDAEAMKKFGSTMVVWDLKALTPKKVLSVPGAPLEIRWSLHEGDNWAITAAAAHLQALAGEAGRGGRVAGQGRRHHRRSRPRSRSRWTSASAATAPASG